MDNFSKKATHEFCKELLCKVVEDSVTLRKKLSFNEHSKLYEYVKNISYKDGIEIIFELGVRDYESRFGRLLKMGLSAAAGGYIASKFGASKKIGFGVGAMVGYLFKKFTDPCWLACRKVGSDEKQICKYNCFIKGCDSIIKDIRTQITKCDQTPNPLSCERKLNKVLLSWQQRREEYVEKLELAKDQYAEREAKKRLKAKPKGV